MSNVDNPSQSRSDAAGGRDTADAGAGRMNKMAWSDAGRRRAGDQRSVSMRRGDVPAYVADYYRAESRLFGRLDFYATREARAPAFRDSGRMLSTRLESPAIAKDLAAIARHRGWDRIRVSGTRDFRRRLWLEAAGIGLTVDGYRPTTLDQIEAERAVGAKAGREHALPETTGRLVEVGAKPYGGIEGNTPSSFIVVEKADNTQETIWGVGLPAALTAAGTSVGDEISVRRAGQSRVVVPFERRDPETGAVTREEREVTRNDWIVEKRSIRPERSKDARTPAPRGALSQLRVIEAVVTKFIRDPVQREAMMQRARERVSKALDEGRSFPQAVLQEIRKREVKSTERSR